MKTIIKYRAPMFCGWLPGCTLRTMQYDTDGRNIGLDYDSYGRVFIISGTAAPEAVRALVKAFGGSFETIV